MDSANAVQAAIFDVLSGDTALATLIGEDAIFDRRQSGKPMPYLVIAEIVTSDLGAGVEEHVITIEAWSDAPGRKQVQEIAGRVRVLLDDAAPETSGVAFVNLQHRTTRVRRELKSKAFVAAMTFRAVTE
jgi:hypothetical protein